MKKYHDPEISPHDVANKSLREVPFDPMYTAFVVCSTYPDEISNQKQLDWRLCVEEGMV